MVRGFFFSFLLVRKLCLIQAVQKQSRASGVGGYGVVLVLLVLDIPVILLAEITSTVSSLLVVLGK